MLMGDLNAKAKLGPRLIDFSTSKNMVSSSTTFIKGHGSRQMATP